MTIYIFLKIRHTFVIFVLMFENFFPSIFAKFVLLFLKFQTASLVELTGFLFAQKVIRASPQVICFALIVQNCVHVFSGRSFLMAFLIVFFQSQIFKKTHASCKALLDNSNFFVLLPLVCWIRNVATIACRQEDDARETNTLASHKLAVLQWFGNDCGISSSQSYCALGRLIQKYQMKIPSPNFALDLFTHRIVFMMQESLRLPWDRRLVKMRLQNTHGERFEHKISSNTGTPSQETLLSHEWKKIEQQQENHCTFVPNFSIKIKLGWPGGTPPWLQQRRNDIRPVPFRLLPHYHAPLQSVFLCDKATPTKTTSERRPPSTTGCYKIRLLNLRVLQNISSHDKMFQIQACTGFACPISSWTRSLTYKGALDFEKLVGVYPRVGKPFRCYNLLLSIKMIAAHLWNWLQNPKNRTPRELAKCSKMNICLNWKILKKIRVKQMLLTSFM